MNPFAHIKFPLQRSMKTSFIMSLFLLHIPYVYVLPFHTPLFNTYTLARVFIMFCFLLVTLHPIFSPYRKVQKDTIFVLLVATLAGQALSIFSVERLPLFTQRLEDLFFSVIFYYCAVVYIQLTKGKMPMRWMRYCFYALIAATGISVFDELMAFLFSEYYISYASAWLHPSQVEFITINLFRDRLYVNRYHEALIPIFIASAIGVRTYFRKSLLIILVAAIFFLALVSGWRIRLVAAICSFIGTAWVFFPHTVKRDFNTRLVFILAALSAIMLLVISSRVMHSYFGYSTFGRLTFESEEDVEALTSRLDFFDKSLYLFRTHPFFGVGLGHYHISGEQPYRFYNSYFRERELEAQHIALSPHNIFFQSIAETGLLGTIPFIALFAVCMFYDMRRIFNRKNAAMQRIYICSFWSLFLFSQFHSPMGFHYFALLFGLRAAIRYAE